MFGVAFLYTGSLWFLFIVEVPPCGLCWMSDFLRFPGYGSLCRCSGVWSWISSLWSAMKCPVLEFGVAFTACILKLRAMFLCCWRICMLCLALELVESWAGLGFSVDMEAFG